MGKENLRKYLSLVLSIIILVMSLPINLVNLYAEEDEYSNYLEGWKVEVAWSNMSYDYEWNATQPEQKQAKLYVTYRVDNAERNYNVGELKFTIKGIDAALRGGMLKAQNIAADLEDALWDYTYDDINGVYVFTNKFEVPAGRSISGGFEFMWTLTAREDVNGFILNESPIFSVSGETNGSINLPPINYTFTSERDKYRIYMSYSKFSADAWDSSNRDYTWYTINNSFNVDMAARGLYRSSYYVWFDLPEDTSIDDFIFDGFTPILDANGHYGFYLWDSKSGDITHGTRTEVFRIGCLTSKTEGKTIVLNGHLSRLYEDETEWVEDADINEIVDDFVSIEIISYAYEFSGSNYGIEKTGDSYPSSPYSKRLLSNNLYNKTIINYGLEGSFHRSYSEASSIQTFSDIPIGIDEEVAVKEISEGKKYAELYGNNRKNIMTLSAVSDIPPSELGEEDPYNMILGDDKLAIQTISGDFRYFKDEEYNINYITILKPKKNEVINQGIKYEVFAATASDTPFDEYIQIGNGIVGGQDTQFNLSGQDYKAIFVKFNNIVGVVDLNVKLGVELNFNWSEMQESDDTVKVNHEGYFINSGYVRFFTKDEVEIGTSRIEYAGTLADSLKEHDISIYGQYLSRDYHYIYLRSAVTNMNTNISMPEFYYDDNDKRYSSSIEARGVIKADEEGPLKKFSMFIQLPDGISTDFYNNEVVINTLSGTYEGQEEIANLQNYVTISEEEYQGHRLIALNFDFTNSPLEISSNVEFLVSFPIYLTRVNFKTYGTLYKAFSYLTIQDEGIDQLVGNNLMYDEYDIDKDGSNLDYIVRSDIQRTVSETVVEWQENVDKYVKTYYSDGYETSSVVSISNEDVDGEVFDEDLGCYYEYRLDYDLGANAAGDIVFYDSIEQGAEIVVAGSSDDEIESIQSEWQGTFVDVDASDLIRHGGKVVYYYSTDADMMKKSTTSEGNKKPNGLRTEGWKIVENNDWSKIDKSTIKSIAVYMDTKDMPKGFLQAPDSLSLYIKMRAPSDKSFLGKEAVNQFRVGYTGYSLIGDDPEERYSLPSAATHVTLMESVTNLVIQKVDADNILRYDSEGNPVYARLTDGAFTIYKKNEDGAYLPLEGYAWPMSLNSMGRIVLTNIPQGEYGWSETIIPNGYYIKGENGERVRNDVIHPISLNSNETLIEVKNYRILGTVFLGKYDAQAVERGMKYPIGSAVFKLYKSNGQQVFYSNYRYTEDMNDPNLRDIFVVGYQPIFDLPWGSYYFIEEEAPLGYERIEEPIYFTIGKEDYNEYDSYEVIKYIEACNEQQTATLRLIKKDYSSGELLPDVMFDLYRRKEGAEREDTLIASNLRTNIMGEIEVSGLQFGSYYFVETRNAPGYTMISGNIFTAPPLNSSTVGQTVTFTVTNPRMVGSAQLVKKDDFGQYVEGAVYELFWKSDIERLTNGEFIERGEYRTDSDGTIKLTYLPDWGTYYFIEKEAPQGYELSNEKLYFILDKDTVQTEILIEATDSRALGKIQVLKVDKEDNNILLPNAEFDLFDINGNPMVAGENYETDRADNKIKTDSDGQVTIQKLKQGSYYLQETVAPNGYSKLSDPIRFSVTLESSTTLQVLKVENEKGKATITINKEINEVYDDFGNPTFIFSVTNKDTGRVYTKSITLSELQLSGSITFTVDANHKYDIYEYESTRYNLVSIGKGSKDVNIETNSIDIEKNSCIADLTAGKEYAEVTYENNISQYEKLSDSANVVNIVKKSSMITALKVKYVGPTPISDETMKDRNGYIEGYNPNTEEYTFQNEDLIITAIYDDGTEVRLTLSEVELSKEYVSGQSGNTGETIIVTRTENGITVSDTFQVEIALTYSERYTVIIDCDGGTILPDKNWT